MQGVGFATPFPLPPDFSRDRILDPKLLIYFRNFSPKFGKNDYNIFAFLPDSKEASEIYRGESALLSKFATLSPLEKCQNIHCKYEIELEKQIYYCLI